MKIIVTKEDIPGLVYWTGWAVTIFINLTLVIGSFEEWEPLAGERFGIVTAILFIAGPAYWFLRKRQLKKKKSIARA